MTFDPNETLQRFHRILVREIQASNPEYLTAPFSVAEIYQNLVPYRTHRDEIGVEMNADYEHALLRLLAGENDFLTIESKTAREEIQEELESPNPNTGLYRDFAAADVRLNPEMIDEALMWDRADEGGILEEEVSGAEPLEESADAILEVGAEMAGSISEGEDGPVGGDLSEEEEIGTEEEDMAKKRSETYDGTEESLEEGALDAVAGSDGEADSGEVRFELSDSDAPTPSGADPEEEDRAVAAGQESPPAAGPGAETCAWCRETLPQRPGVNFCPFCGCSVHLVPCSECGEELELIWRFCIACGTEVSS
jgi:hypothetical protein